MTRWRAPRTWAAETPRTWHLQQALRDNMIALGEWLTWEPVWRSGLGDTDLADGEIDARYVHAGKLVTVQFYFEMGADTDPGTLGWTWSLPVPAAESFGFYPGSGQGMATGVGLYRDDSTSQYYPGRVVTDSDSAFAVYCGTTYLGGTPPVTPAEGDSVRASFVYEAA